MREEYIYLLEKLKGERTPDVSLAAQPKALTGCCSSGAFSITRLIAVSVLPRKFKQFLWAEGSGECGTCLKNKPGKTVSGILGGA